MRAKHCIYWDAIGLGLVSEYAADHIVVTLLKHTGRGPLWCSQKPSGLRIQHHNCSSEDCQKVHGARPTRTHGELVTGG